MGFKPYLPEGIESDSGCIGVNSGYSGPEVLGLPGLQILMILTEALANRTAEPEDGFARL
jgi:hypothetical protein